MHTLPLPHGDTNGRTGPFTKTAADTQIRIDFRITTLPYCDRLFRADIRTGAAGYADTAVYAGKSF